ncbi:hypothetical protein BD310DRAFT_1023449, partial [Dichomitus squalens]
SPSWQASVCLPPPVSASAYLPHTLAAERLGCVINSGSPPGCVPKPRCPNLQMSLTATGLPPRPTALSSQTHHALCAELPIAKTAAHLPL